MKLAAARILPLVAMLAAAAMPGLLAAATPAPASPAPGPAPTRAALPDTLAAIVARTAAANPSAPGVVATVVCPRLGLRWSGAAGLADHDGPPLTPAHTLRIASNTKTYVAAAVLRLVEEGRLALDQPVEPLLPPAWRDLLAGDGYDLQAITIEHLLSHTGGLDEHAGDPRYGEAIIADPQHRWTAEEQLRRCVEWTDPVGAPGEGFFYSDTGYLLLGRIVEDVTGQPLGPAVRTLLDYDRLGLHATWWELMEPAPAGAAPRAHQYFGPLDSHDWHPSLDLYGGGGLVADVHDLAAFMRALIGGQVLREEATLKAMTGRGTTRYRLGVVCADLSGHLGWGHQGFWNTFAFHVPSLDLTVAGALLDHEAVNGRELADALVAAVAAATGDAASAAPSGAASAAAH